MTVAAWRIAVEAAAYTANDLSGIGAKLTGGRWNSEGRAMVYCASTIALATLETLHALRGSIMPFNRYLVRIDIPDEVWNARETLDPAAGWDAIPAGMTASSAGDAWLAGGSSAVLLVPSVIVPEECNVLINPAHPHTKRISATTLKRWHYDPRFFP